MKKIKKTELRLFIGIMATMIVIASCSETSSADGNLPTKDVLFSVQTELDVQPFTRAGIGNDKVTSLLIIDKCDGVAKTLTKSSSDADFAAPKLTLTYGTHELTFVTHKDDGLTYNEDSHKLVFSGVNDNLFIKTVSLTVDKNTTAQSVTLTRKVAQARVKILDAIPAGLKKVTLKFGAYYREYSISSGFGITSTVETKEYTGWTAGKVNEEVYANTLVPSADFKTDLTITFLATDDAVIRQVVQKDVPLYENRKTTVSGHFFTHGDTFSVTVDNEWGEDVVVEWSDAQSASE